MQPDVCRLFVIVAREARTAVIFRHGPKAHVRLIRWDLETDRFEPGQWFTGTIHDRLADLSPSGEWLIYFASRPGGEIPAWTAISRPPYLTALALWPVGDGLAGGGIMDSDLAVRLNHRPGEMKVAHGFKVRPGMAVTARRCWGEWDGGLYDELLRLNGWRTDTRDAPKPTAKLSAIYEKVSGAGHRLMMQITRQGGRDNPREHIDYEVVLAGGEVWGKLHRIDWADWDGNGDLLYSQDGRLYRIAAAQIGAAGEVTVQALADFRAMTFEAMQSPPGAKHWPYATKG